MPQVVIAAAAYVVGTAAFGSFVIAGVTIAWGSVLAAAAMTVYGQVQARRARAKARDAYNASLKDRLQMIDVVPDAPRTLVLGRVRTVEGIRRRWTTGTHSEKLTMVISFAGHEIDAFEQFYFNDTPVTLDGSGYVITSPWRKETAKARQQNVTLGAGGAATFDTGATIVPGSIVAVQRDGDSETPLAATMSGTSIVLSGGTAGGVAAVLWQESRFTPKARIRTWTGAPGQNVGAAIASEYPGRITATDRFAGMAVAVVDLDYDEDVFPQGVPNITALVRGAKVLDPRTGTTAWSENPALHAYHYARYAAGFGLPVDEVRTADAVAAANDCEVSTVFRSRRTDGSIETRTLPRYRCGIVIPDGTDPREAMDDIMETMAGRWGWAGGTWRFRAGASAAPVFALTQDWVAQRLDDTGEPSNAAVVRITSGVPRESKVNAVTGTCVDDQQRYQVLPIPRVADEVLIAAEGEWPDEVELQGVTSVAHAVHLQMVRIRELQASLRLEVSCNFSAYKTELFDVGTLLLPRYGMTPELAKPAEVTGWTWHPTQGVTLSLAETSAAIYEPADELVGKDPAPNSDLVSPFNVPEVTGITIDSGTDQLLLQADGSIVARMRVRWTEVLDERVRNGGGFDVRYGLVTTNPDLWGEVQVRGDTTEVFLDGVQDGVHYGVTIRARNALVRGQWSALKMHRVLGKTAPPRNVPSVTASITTDGVSIVVPENADLDRDVTELRVGGLDWDSAVPLVGSEPTRFAGTTYVWPRPGPGTYRIRARYIDTSGNDSVADAWTDITVTVADSLAWGSISGRPKAYRMVSNGYLASSASPHAGGLFDGESDAAIAGAARSYVLVVWDRATDAIVHNAGYDVIGVGAVGGRNAATLAADLDYYSTTTGTVRAGRYILAIFTADEPRDNRLTGGLLGSMKRNGATQEVFGGGSVTWMFRSAYALVAISGCGEGNAILEGYRGAIDGDPAAWIDVSFQIKGGQVYGLTSSAGSIKGAMQAAANAAAAAAAAQTDASAAMTAINAIASDNVLSRAEKSRAIQDWNVLSSESSGISAQADNYVVTSEKTSYLNALSNLANYLVALSPPWADTSSDTPISGATWRSLWQSAYTARQAVLDKIAANAKARLGALATLNAVDTPQIVDGAATVPLTVVSSTGTVSAFKSASPGIWPAYYHRIGPVVSWTNPLSVSVLVQIECSAMLSRDSGTATVRGHLEAITSSPANYDDNNSDAWASYMTVDPAGSGFSRVTVYTVPPGATVYAYLGITIAANAGEETVARWRQCVLRLTAIKK